LCPFLFANFFTNLFTNFFTNFFANFLLCLRNIPKKSGRLSTNRVIFYVKFELANN